MWTQTPVYPRMTNQPCRCMHKSIFTFTTLRYPNGAVHYVWLYDANIHYLKGKHIYLFVDGMLVLCPSFAFHLWAGIVPILAGLFRTQSLQVGE